MLVDLDVLVRDIASAVAAGQLDAAKSALADIMRAEVEDAFLGKREPVCVIAAIPWNTLPPIARQDHFALSVWFAFAFSLNDATMFQVSAERWAGALATAAAKVGVAAPPDVLRTAGKQMRDTIATWAQK